MKQPEYLTYEQILNYEIISCWYWWAPHGFVIRTCARRAKRKWDRMTRFTSLFEKLKHE